MGNRADMRAGKGSQRWLLALWAVLVALCGCVRGSAHPDPAWPTDGWPTSTPEEQGMDSGVLADMLGVMLEEGYAIDSVLVVRNGYLVLDATIYPFRSDSKHIVYSCTKSVISALVGMAIDQGHIAGVGQVVLDLFPGRQVDYLDADKRAMTVEDLLTMSTGLACRDSYLYRWQGLSGMRRSADWVQFVLDLPMADRPGVRFEYCNGASYLLSAAIQQATDQTALAYAQEHLFTPLGITDVEWPASPQGITIGYSDLRMRPHDMAKFGYLYLSGGSWEGGQVVPAEWVRASTRKHVSATLSEGYGYHWWVDDSGYYMALGYAGQFIMVLPEQDGVVVFTSHLADRDFGVPQRLLEEYIIPAARSRQPLPANPDGVALLASHVEALAAGGAGE